MKTTLSVKYSPGDKWWAANNPSNQEGSDPQQFYKVMMIAIQAKTFEVDLNEIDSTLEDEVITDQIDFPKVSVLCPGILNGQGFADFIPIDGLVMVWSEECPAPTGPIDFRIDQ